MSPASEALFGKIAPPLSAPRRRQAQTLMSSSGPITAIATYKPKAGLADTLADLLRAHEDALRQRGCLHADPITRLPCNDGTVLEILEWRDDESRTRAAVDPTVMAAWQAIEAVVHIARRIDLG